MSVDAKQLKNKELVKIDFVKFFIFLDSRCLGNDNFNGFSKA